MSPRGNEGSGAPRSNGGSRYGGGKVPEGTLFARKHVVCRPALGVEFASDIPEGQGSRRAILMPIGRTARRPGPFAGMARLWLCRR
jgi:hypothetical protein